ncbi:TrkH family potassium uptake protein [Salinimonas chungwhensis]|uniref:TrkH family potassium uptake protein n=1 Tax=Salinimonas chungwhensis TaxID=265425 RepID=UPI00037D7491|nr:potassium transporter TrkG [Salinimonas chungwhensis]
MSSLRVLETINPAKVLLLGYASYVVLGWFFLSLPLSQSVPVSNIDNFFTATSAVSTTGLVTVDPSLSYTFFGELVILFLIQLGGIGYMTFGSFVILSTRHKMSSFRTSLTKSAFALPADFEIGRFIKMVVIFTLVCEAIGAIALYIIFLGDDVDGALWSAIFHSISAFCTAGFSLNNNSLMDFVDNPMLNFVIAALAYMGAIGFIVATDIWQRLTGKQKYLHFTTKIILEVTLWFAVVGTILLFVIEPSVQSMPPWQRLMASFFQVMTASTTVGFNTIDIGGLSAAIIMLMYVFMIFGASPSGTGGGLKSTTLAALLGLIKSTLKRRETVRIHKRELSQERLQIATASFAFYMVVLTAAMILLLASENAAFDVILFEAISALGTVGLSMGLTGDLTVLGKLIIILLMLMGRVGILTFGIAMAMHDESPEEEKDDDLVV